MKFLTITLLCLSFFAAQKVAGQPEDAGALLLEGATPVEAGDFANSQYQEDAAASDETCPEGGMAFYKDCKGSLDQCSKCLGSAESACEKALGKSCSLCTTGAGVFCNSAKQMCFGDTECGSGYSCVNYECVRES